jgi:molecular chaperone GrpE (heat shock protein)
MGEGKQWSGPSLGAVPTEVAVFRPQAVGEGDDRSPRQPTTHRERSFPVPHFSILDFQISAFYLNFCFLLSKFLRLPFQPLATRRCADGLFFRYCAIMNNVSEWKVPKWPFLLGDGALLVFAGYLVWQARHPLGLWEVVICASCVALGAVLGVIPFVLEYRATARLIEVNGLETVAEKIQHLDQVASQIAVCTNDWTNAQTQAEKTSAGAREVAERMGVEARQFAEFMQRMNDSEKAALRLEVDKLHRAEGDWLQVLVRILDNVFALHAAAEHAGQPRVAGQIAQFQNACHDAARRVGLVPFGAEPEEPFDAERHQPMGLKDKPPVTAVVAETVGLGFKYQGKMVRPVLVRLRENGQTAVESPTETPEDSRQMTLETPE